MVIDRGVIGIVLVMILIVLSIGLYLELNDDESKCVREPFIYGVKEYWMFKTYPDKNNKCKTCGKVLEEEKQEIYT